MWHCAVGWVFLMCWRIIMPPSSGSSSPRTLLALHHIPQDSMFSNTAHTKCYLPSALELFPTVTHHNFCTVQRVWQDQLSQFCYCNGHTWRISWMYSQPGVCAIQTYTALKDQRLYTCTGNNNITKSVLCDAGHRLYQTLLYIKNVIQFHETHMNVISLTSIRRVDFPCQFSQNSQVFNSVLCTSLIPKFMKTGQ